MISIRISAVLGVVLAALLTGSASIGQTQTLQVCCTVTDLGSLVEYVGGDRVSVTTFAKGTEDAHFVDAKPSFVRALNRADLLVYVGLELEVGYLPPILQGARNANVLPGARGNLDCSSVIRPLEVPSGRVDRSMGDVHAGGNPHYLSDPLSGLKVAELIRDKLIELQPSGREYFQQRYDAFAKRMCQMLVGDELAARYSPTDVLKLALLFQHGKLGSFLKSQNQETLLGGWFGMMLPYYGSKAVDDHSIWAYFARTFGVQIVAHMEATPGIPPSTSRLSAVVEIMRQQEVKIILASAYYDPRHAQFLASQTGARVVSMANQVGARAGANDYIAMVDYNVRQIVAALREPQ